MSRNDDRCMKPQNPDPYVTTSFCVYRKGHEGDHSWEHTPATFAVRLKSERNAEKTQ